jgi:ferrochelatase
MAAAHEPKIGVLITNLGSPAAPDKKSLRCYLKQFLTDPRVIQPVVGKIAWWFILNVIILNTRPKKSAKLYASIWNRFGPGAPLLAITKKQLEALQQQFEKTPIQLAMAMRYGQPEIEKGIKQLLAQNSEKIIILPLYPQYSRTTTESTFDIIKSIQHRHSHFPQVHLIKDYHQNPLYISALKQSILQHWQKHGQADKLIISYHGIPKLYVEKGDIYPQQCQRTTELLIKELGLSEDQYQVCYQSRFGRLQWLQPYLDETLRSLPDQGVKSVHVICPGFSADCLETLEEIEQENRGYFIQAGGQHYSYIPALNDSPAHIKCLAQVIKQTISEG